jgi:acyl carrier protein
MSLVLNMSATEAQVRFVLSKHARLSVDVLSLDANADLYQAGMTSHASVNVMLALEGQLDIEFPDELLKRSVFASINSICEAVSTIGQT